MRRGRTKRSKITYITWGIMCTMAVIAGRLFYLQIHLKNSLYTQSQKNFLRVEKIIPPRGNILDRSGALLVTNRPTTDLYWYGSGNRKLSDMQLHTLRTIGEILDTPITDELLNDLNQIERYSKKMPLSFDLPFDKISKIEELYPTDQNLKLAAHFKRFYPHKTWCCHVLGYLGNLDVEAHGKMGLERVYEDTLKGEPGANHTTINSFGRNFGSVEVKKAFAGDNLHTTIDLNLQEIAETIFPQDAAGTCIIMDPETGDLLALVSRPNFDPGMFLEPMSNNDWQALQDKQPFLNRAFNAAYPPGSIFKLVTVSAALEHNIISPDAVVDCHGFVTFGNRRHYCHKKEGHGELSACQAVAQSCNILFYDIGKRIDIDLLAQYGNLFGLGKPTGIVFPEKTGLVPNRAWKRKAKHERWWTGETLSAAIGQSFLLVTPIQTACLISAILTGFLVKPRILLTESVITQPLDIQAQTRSFLKRSMKAVVTRGTGHNVNTIKDFVIYAKTSTAQTSALTMREMGKQYLEHGCFAAHVTYKNGKPFTMVVLIENIGSSSAATTVAKDYLIAYKKMMDSSLNS